MRRKTYGGSQGGLSIEKRLVFKQRQKQAFETHLQAFLLQNIWRDDLSALLEIDPAAASLAGQRGVVRRRYAADGRP